MVNFTKTQPNIFAFSMNKSVLTNVLSILIVLLGYVFAGSVYQPILTNIGFFALSGSLTNWLAIYMLFEKVPFLYGSGVISQQFETFKFGIKNLVMQEFFTQENISAVISHVTIDKNKWKNIADSLNYDMIYEALVEGILDSAFGKMITMMGGQNAIEPLRVPITTKLRLAVYEMLKDENLQKQWIEEFIGNQKGFLLTIEKIVDNRLAILTPIMVKDIIQRMIRQHLGWLVVWGGVFGGLIGLITSFV